MTAGALALVLVALCPGPGVAGRAQALAAVLLAEALAAGVDPALAGAVAAHESAYRQSAIGRHGELGVMQVLPTGRALRWCRPELADLGALRPNVRCGLKLLRRALAVCRDDWGAALTHYNGGRCASSGYATRVLGRLARAGVPIPVPRGGGAGG